MSLTFESPTRGGNEAYFTPLNMPTIHTNTTATEETSTNTPYYTAPINPGLHQDFLNAIQARHSTQPTVLSAVASPTRADVGFSLNMGSLAHRRQPPSLNNSPVAAPLEANALAQLLSAYKDKSHLLLLLDVRSFVQFSHSKIRTAINISIPNTILKRPTFTLDKVYEAIVLEESREKLKTWSTVETIVFYDQQSQLLQENSASAYLASKLIRAGFKGQLNYLKGGFEAFANTHKEYCESTLSPSSFQQQQRLMMASALGPPTDSGFNLSSAALKGGRPKLRLNNLPMATPSLGPFTAPMPQFENQAFNPFFSNIRQNMELSHGPIRERFPVRLPSKCNMVDPTRLIQATESVPRCVAGGHMENGLFQAPGWLHETVQENGAQILAETYEKLERTEQRRLQNIMHFHSKHTDNPAEFPFSIVAGIEMGALNRYTNIWPFEYTRVKIRQHGVSDYINASYVQYIESNDTVSDARPDGVDTETVKIMKTCVTGENTQPYRRYISTQGPLPATFNDFWQVVWEQNSRVLVMLTKEEEMNKIKCHRYWPSTVNAPIQYGDVTITLTEETVRPVLKIKGDDQPLNPDDVVIVRALKLSRLGEERHVTHLQYTGWMDFGVPDNPLGTLQIIQMADEAQAVYESAGPMIVHCSAGCGRSGAFCAIDTVLYRISMDKDLADMRDILLQTISRFREQRLSMVQTLRQFVFCYEAIWWWFLGHGLEKSVDVMDTSS
ncbi:hypothetical protein INT47_003867 [Mucor saturninus]|uniref:protein-tyrosine-phosphatase n=1 Tax=Mucor saturninus TaxID=64648 RepID=A0A8H7QZK3_9FUNG|nr:hypothetical protein INT47_003867 [Mucor saturninus]